MKEETLRAADICHKELVTVDENESIVDVSKTMREQGIGDVVVTSPEDGHDVPIGIVTDRDIVVHAVALDVSIATLKAGDLLYRSLATVDGDADLLEIARQMNTNAVRRLIVVDQAQVIGIVTLDDVLVALNVLTSHISASLGRQIRDEQNAYAGQSAA